MDQLSPLPGPNLPAEYLQLMQSYLGDEYPQFLGSYHQPATVGLRINLLKLDVQAFQAINPFSLSSLAWCPSGFLVSPADQPGKHPFHAAGLYYIQEPSAMAVGEVLDPQPGERVLDLAAAPGGKATHLASLMGSQGILVVNEIVRKRAWELAANMERWGARNAVILNETPQQLEKHFEGYFDRVLLDAPCSGEGMFRKNETAGQEWSRESMVACAHRQDELLETASRLVRPGGVLVYSTCTFNPLENERVIANFLKSNPGFALEKPVEFPGSQTGRPEWAEGYLDAPKLTDTLRLWPHRVTGEGHFIAGLRRENTFGDAQVKLPGFRVKKPNREMDRLFKAFCQSSLQNLDDLPGVDPFQFPGSAAGNLSQEGTYLYWLHPELPDLSGLRVVHPGWWLGTFKKARFEPSHALALGLRTDQVRQVVNLPAQSADVLNYLRGQGLDQPGADGWVLVCVEGFPLGWGKRLSGTVKNFYPKGLRWS